MTQDEIENRFTTHKVDAETALSMTHIRAQFKGLALAINLALPDGREKSLALTDLEQALSWTNAGLARNQKA